MDFILNFLVKHLDKDILTILGENSPTPLILAMMKVPNLKFNILTLYFVHL